MLSDQDLAKFISQHHIKAQLVYSQSPTPTVSDAAKALGVELQLIIKTLIFMADDKPIAAIAAGEHRISQKRLRDILGVSRRKLRMASPEEALSFSGFPVGAMPPFGHKEPLPTYVDSLSIDQAAPLLYGGGGTSSAMLALSAQTLLTVSQGSYVALSFSEEE
ncbi:MAG: YbaK/EbsC family protein [Deinococcales bacterium]